jgi:hypothetical protein
MRKCSGRKGVGLRCMIVQIPGMGWRGGDWVAWAGRVDCVRHQQGGGGKTTLRDGELLLRLRVISSWGAETRGWMEEEGRC